jgi:putative sigma-54 modulation protein
VELTGPLTDYVNKKIGHTLEKLGAPVTKVDVHLSVNKNPRISEGHVAEVTTFAKGFVIRATEKSESMYASVDLVADRLARKLRKYKERVVHSRRARASTSDLAAAAEEMWEDALPNGVTDVADEYSDNVVPQADMSVVKEKKFPMPPCTVEDAVTCLDFLDHDFYVFRNAETSEINVVYKRNHGGVGLIQPERD